MEDTRPPAATEPSPPPPAAGDRDPSFDAGQPAALIADAGTLDAGTVDAGSLDAGSLDAGALVEDAGASDSGSSDGGSVPVAVDAGVTALDGGELGGPSRCGGASFKLCDGFESGTIDSQLWTRVLTAGATVSVDKVHAARGSYALHIHTSNAASTTAYLKETRTFPVSQNSFYGRAFVFQAGPLAEYNWNYFSASGNNATYNLGGTTHPFGSATGTRVVRFNYQPMDWPSNSQTAAPVNRWACWEWWYQGGTNTLRAWLDGHELTDMAVNGGTADGTWSAPNPFTSLAIGFHHAHPDVAPAFDVWIDEVAVDTNRIGCDR